MLTIPARRLALRFDVLLCCLLLLIITVQPAASQLTTNRAADSLLFKPALQRIVDLQVERDAEALIGHLTHNDPVHVARAAFALASVQDPTAAPSLSSLLDHPDPQVRADAAFALGQSLGTVSSAVLLQALNDEDDPVVRQELLQTLGKKGNHDALEQLADWPAEGDAAQAALALSLARFGLRELHADQAVRRLSMLLASENESVRLHAAYYFGRVPTAAPWAGLAESVRSRLTALRPGDPAAMHLVLALDRLGDPSDTALLIAWLQQATDWRTRTNAARALGSRTDDASVRAVLLAHLDDPSEHVATVAATALAGADTWSEAETEKLRAWVDAHPQAWRVTAALLPALSRRGLDAFVLENVRQRRDHTPLSFASGLGSLAGVSRTEAFELLADAAEDEDARVAYAALDALSSRWATDRADPSRTAAYFSLFSEALRRQDLATSYVAAPVLSDSLFRAFGSVALLEDVYGKMRTPEDIEPMTAILAALGSAGDRNAQPLLRDALSHPHPVIRRAAADALAALTGDSVPLPSGSETPDQRVDWAYLRAKGTTPRLVLETEKGRIVLLLSPEQAPLTVQTLLRLAEADAFDDVPFHRVVPNFVIQGGDFERGDGFGGPGFSIRSEFTRIPYLRGTAGMASAGKDTEGSQYFVTHSMQSHLDGRYTAFGVVMEGQEVVDRIYAGDNVVKAMVLDSP